VNGRWLLPALCAAGLAGSVAPAPAQTFQKYQCRDGAEFMLGFFSVDPRIAYLQLDGKSIALPKRLSFPGRKRYSKSGVSLSTNGKAVTLKRGGRTSDCELVQAY